MSSIGSLASPYASTSTSSYASSARTQRPDPAEMQQKLFAQLDSDSSGSVDATELQKALDALAQSSGKTATVSASDMLAQLDSDGSGGISQSELSSAVESSRPPPPPGGGRGGPPPMSTADFARSHNDSGTDPLMALDGDSDGSVSEAEFGITDSSDDSMKTFFKAVDADGDGQITSTEASAFKDKLATQLQSALSQMSGAQGGDAACGGGGGQSASGDSSSASSNSSYGKNELSLLAMLANAQYAAIGSGVNSSSSSTLALA